MVNERWRTPGNNAIHMYFVWDHTAEGTRGDVTTHCIL